MQPPPVGGSVTPKHWVGKWVSFDEYVSSSKEADSMRKHNGTMMMTVLDARSCSLYIFYRLNGATLFCRSIFVGGDLRQQSFCAGGAVYVWLGKDSSAEERKGATANASSLLTSLELPSVTPVCLVKEVRIHLSPTNPPTLYGPWSQGPFRPLI